MSRVFWAIMAIVAMEGMPRSEHKGKRYDLYSAPHQPPSNPWNGFTYPVLVNKHNDLNDMGDS